LSSFQSAYDSKIKEEQILGKGIEAFESLLRETERQKSLLVI
jgi:hypothetical protein